MHTGVYQNRLLLKSPVVDQIADWKIPFFRFPFGVGFADRVVFAGSIADQKSEIGNLESIFIRHRALQGA
jgi:hypothetical protein